jgi:acyl-CoA thioesterase FadM
MAVDFKSPAYLDDLLHVESRLNVLSRVKVGFEYQVRRQTTDGLSTIATGSTLLACVGNDHKPLRMSKDAEQLLLSPELREGEIHA